MDEEKQEYLKKALRQIAQNVEHHGGLQPEEFTEEDFDLMYSLGYALYESGDYEKGMQLFQKLVAAAPHEKKFWMGLASSAQMLHDFSSAITAWSMLTFIDHLEPSFFFHSAECLFSLRKCEEAKIALNDAIKLLDLSKDSHVELHEKIKALQDSWEGASESKEKEEVCLKQ